MKKSKKMPENSNNVMKNNGNGLSVQYDGITFKQTLEAATTILLLLAIEKSKSYEGKFNGQDEEAIDYFNIEVQDLLQMLVPSIMKGGTEKDATKKFKCRYKDFVIQYLPYVGQEISEMFPDCNFENPKESLVQMTMKHLSDMYQYLRSIFGDKEFIRIHNSILDDLTAQLNACKE